MAQERGVQLGMAFLDGSNIRAHRPAAGVPKRGATEADVLRVRRLADLVVALSAVRTSLRGIGQRPMAPKPA
jgi:hypothetical protein